nr:MAG TPA: hypothetical protein [Caudoviricetes sp.]
MVIIISITSFSPSYCLSHELLSKLPCHFLSHLL